MGPSPLSELPLRDEDLSLWNSRGVVHNTERSSQKTLPRVLSLTPGKDPQVSVPKSRFASSVDERLIKVW